MDNLILEMTGESIDHIGQLVVSKLNQKDPNERREIINKIFNALYEPIIPKDDKLERVIGFLREMYGNYDEETQKSLRYNIQTLCMETETHDNNSGNIVDNIGIAANNANRMTFAGEPRWMGKNKKVGKSVKILVGMQYGTIAQVDSFDQDKVLVKLANGKTVKYMQKHLQFLE